MYTPLGFSGGSDGKETACNAGDLSSIPGSGRCPREGKGYPLQYSLFFKILFIYFNWRLITLQYCGGFCHTLMWISHRYTCVPPSWKALPPHASGLSQSTGFERPASCIELALAIYFTHSNTRFNAILSNHPTLASSHRVQKSVLYICVSFAVLHIGSLLPSF